MHRIDICGRCVTLIQHSEHLKSRGQTSRKLDHDDEHSTLVKAPAYLQQYIDVEAITYTIYISDSSHHL